MADGQENGRGSFDVIVAPCGVTVARAEVHEVDAVAQRVNPLRLGTELDEPRPQRLADGDDRGSALLRRTGSCGRGKGKSAIRLMSVPRAVMTTGFAELAAEQRGSDAVGVEIMRVDEIEIEASARSRLAARRAPR